MVVVVVLVVVRVVLAAWGAGRRVCVDVGAGVGVWWVYNTAHRAINKQTPTLRNYSCFAHIQFCNRTHSITGQSYRTSTLDAPMWYYGIHNIEATDAWHCRHPRYYPYMVVGVDVHCQIS